jgi:hypothetical protein
MSEEDVKEQGDILERLASSVNGFLILDLHNLYCQAENFQISMRDLMNSYPLHLVKEIHISGGSWIEAANEMVRRDSHDGPVPSEVWDSLEFCLNRCPNLEYIILEQMNASLATEEAMKLFQDDFRKAKGMAQEYSNSTEGTIWGNEILPIEQPLNDEDLYRDQQELKRIFSGQHSIEEAKDRLKLLYPRRNWEPKMIETGLTLSKKWN